MQALLLLLTMLTKFLSMYLITRLVELVYNERFEARGRLMFALVTARC